MTSAGTLALYDALNLLKVADITAALDFEAQNGVVDALDHRVHDVRPHSGQLATARNLLKLLEGSKNTTRQGEIRVQDAYSLRCCPQIHGASKDAVNYVKEQDVYKRQLLPSTVVTPNSSMRFRRSRPTATSSSSVAFLVGLMVALIPPPRSMMDM